MGEDKRPPSLRKRGGERVFAADLGLPQLLRGVPIRRYEDLLTRFQPHPAPAGSGSEVTNPGP
jgi:hypothetical protein